jgi:hypothetical protein
MNDDGCGPGVVRFGTEHYLQILDLQTTISVKRLYGVGKGLPTSKDCGKSSSRRIQQRVSLESTLPLLLEGFRKNTNEVKVAIDGYEWELVTGN